MLPSQWVPPCGNQCTNKYSALTQIPWRVFCKKGCDTDGETWEECVEECNEICYKDPVFKEQQWSAYFDRSPGSATYSEQCFRACVSGCGYKLDIHPDEVNKVRPHRAPQLPPVQEPAPPTATPGAATEDIKKSAPPTAAPSTATQDIPGSSA